MSTADYPDALTRRIEQLAAASVEEPEGEGAAVAALVGALRAEIDRLTGSVAASRSETGTLVRRVAELSTRIDGVVGRVDEQTGALTEAIGQRVDDVAGDIHRTLTAALDRDTRAAAEAAAALEDARGAVESRMAALEDALDVTSERIEALSRDGASTTTAKLVALEAGVAALAETVRDEGRDNAERVVVRLGDVTGTHVSALEDTLLDRLSDVVRLRQEELRHDVLEALASAGEQATADRLAVTELAGSVRTALDGFSAALERSLTGLGRSVTSALADGRDATTDSADLLRAAMAETRAEVAELARSGAASTSSVRETADRLADLTAVGEQSRRAVQEGFDGLGTTVVRRADEVQAAMTARVGEAAATLSAELAQLRDGVAAGTSTTDERLAGLDAAVTRAGDAGERTEATLRDLGQTADGLGQTVAGFRAEWPTRTFEVVEGAKAVAQGVVTEVRAEVGAQLERVRSELDRAVTGVQDAGAGISVGTDRLSRAGQVLVAYLEQRDRLLEAERDRVLHDVLDAFSAGLSARERTALSGRVSDAVGRRRDARDADRYRAAVGAPVPPVVDLPDEVRDLAPPRAAEVTAAREADRARVPRTPAQDTGEARRPVRAAPPSGTSTGRTRAPMPRAARPRTGATAPVAAATVPAPDRAGATTVEASTARRPAKAAAGKGAGGKAAAGKGAGGKGAGSKAAAAERRARVDTMPEARSPEVALEAAAPRPAGTDVAGAEEAGTLGQDTAGRRPFRRRTP